MRHLVRHPLHARLPHEAGQRVLVVPLPDRLHQVAVRLPATPPLSRQLRRPFHQILFFNHLAAPQRA